jgi:hypothetical protein
MGLFFLSLAVIAAVMLIMAVGVLFKYPCLRGSCGGPDLVGPEGESLKCAVCPRRNAPADS